MEGKELPNFHYLLILSNKVVRGLSGRVVQVKC